jgi:hypothetical protein
MNKIHDGTRQNNCFSIILNCHDITEILLKVALNTITLTQGFQSGPVPGTFTRLRSCIVPAEITEPPKISGGQNHKYDGR